MLGFRFEKTNREHKEADANGDVAKLFFDTFSGRVGVVENSLQDMSAGFAKLKVSVEHNQVSDLVLLDRLQRVEALIGESLLSIKNALETMSTTRTDVISLQEPAEVVGTTIEPAQGTGEFHARIASHILSPTGELGSLPSITTPTELQVLTLLANEGPRSAPEIGKVLGRSREHTARLMKKLFEEGYVRRDQARIPFRYSVVDRLRQGVRKVDSKDAGKESVSVPQS